MVARYIEAIEHGETPDREKLIAENPALTESIEWFDRAIEILNAAMQQSPQDSKSPENL